MEPKNIAIGGEGEEATRIQTYVEMKANAAKTSAASAASAAAAVGNHPQLIRKKQPAGPQGPQLWAVVFTIGGLYYVWTRVLGRSIRFALPQRSGHRIKGHGGATTTTDIQAARERRLAALENANRAREIMVNQAAAKNNDGNIRERTNVNSGNSNINHNSSSITLEERQRQNQLNMQKRQKQQELEDKKKKQRQLYLRQKALKEKEEEERRKDEELGPGWRAREDPTVVTNLLEQQGNNGGTYKAQTCTRRGG